jgi:hypothetical protein
MNCYISTLLGFSLLFASFYTSYYSDKEIKIFKSILSSQSVKKYNKIIKERSTLYIFGLIIGVILVFIINHKFKYNLTNKFHKLTTYTVIIFITAIIFYTFSPKSDYMLNNINNNKESKALLDIYKNMKHKYITGIILGGISSIPFANSFC